MTYNITAAPVGLLLGYGFTAIIVTLGMNWCWAFLRNVIFILPIACVYFFIKPQYLSISKRIEK
jgi:hypothetical protein